MAGTMRPEVGDLTFKPDVGVFALQLYAYRSNEIAHRPDAALGWPKVEAKLVQRSHSKAVYSRWSATSPASGGDQGGRPERSEGDLLIP